MNDIEIAENLRRILFHGTDSEFQKYILELKRNGLSQTKAYELLLSIWDQLDAKVNEREVDVLTNWLDQVSGNISVGGRIWGKA